jgi:hypothetical protein
LEFYTFVNIAKTIHNRKDNWTRIQAEAPKAKQLEPFATNIDTERFLSKMDDSKVTKESEDITVSP